MARLWNPGENIASSEDPIFCRYNDVSAALAALQACPFHPPAFSVTPNGEDLVDFIDALQHWMAHRTTPPLVRAASGTNALARWVFFNCSVLSRALANHDSVLISDTCGNIAVAIKRISPAQSKCIPSLLPKVVTFIRDVAEEGFGQQESASPFTHGSADRKYKSWWKWPPAHLKNLTDLRKKIIFLFGSAPNGFKSIERWLSESEERIKRMYASPLTPTNVEYAAIEASAYCAAIANRHLMRAQVGPSLQLLHRAADLLFIQLCLNSDLIDMSVYGGQYFLSVEGSRKIGLIPSISRLSGHLSVDASRDADFYELNRWRNILMQTHFMAVAEDRTARQLVSRVTDHLELLGGAMWRTAFDFYTRGISLDVIDIFDADGYLRQCFSRLEY